MTFLKEHPECADSLKLYFDATAINIENTLLQMVSMIGVSKSTIHRYLYYQQQTIRESLEPQRHLCGAKEKAFSLAPLTLYMCTKSKYKDIPIYG